MPGLSIAPKAPAAASAGSATGAALTENDGDGAAKGTFGSILSGQIKSNSQTAKSGAGVKQPDKSGKSDADNGNIDSLATDDAITANAVNDFLALVNAGVAAIQITPAPFAPATPTDTHGGDQFALGVGVAAKTSDVATTQLAGLLGQEFAGSGKILPKSAPADLKDAAVEVDAGKLSVDDFSTHGKICQADIPIIAKPLLEEFKPDKAIPAAVEVGVGDSFASLVTPQAAPMPGRQVAAVQTPTMEISQPVGSNGWGNALADKVTWMSNQGNHVAELHLNPAHLGPLDVQLTIVNDQASAVFVSHHAAVRDAIEAAMPRLRDMLAENGIMLGNTMVGAESFQQQQQQQAFAKQSSGGGGGDRGEISGVMDVTGQTGGTAKAGKGMVDTFV